MSQWNLPSEIQEKSRRRRIKRSAGLIMSMKKKWWLWVIPASIFLLLGCGTPASTSAFQPITFTSNEYKPNQYAYADTATFSIPIKDWIIDWSYTPSGDGVFAFFVFPTTGSDTNDYVASVYKPNTTSGSLSCDAGPGQYLISVTTLCSWSITIHPPKAT